MVKSSIGKILVVDDEVELKNILVEALASRGYETAGSTSGEEALAALRGEAFDVLLTDLMMPEMDGITLVKESLLIDPHIVCMVMTGQGTIQTAVDAMKEGAFDYVLKPFRLQTVLPVLTRAMNTRHMRLENLHLRDTVAIYELAQTIAFTLDPQVVISKLADAALQQTNADEVSVLLPTSDGSELYVAAVRGEKRQHLLGERVPLEESISSWVMHERTPLILDGEVNDERFRAMWPRPEIRSAISVPLQVANKLVGTININALNRARPFTPGQMKALTILASTAAAALESASLYVQVHQAEEDYRSIFENAGEGIFRTSPTGQFITANAAMAHILGYESPQALMAGIADVRGELYADSNCQSDWERRLKQGERIVGFEAQCRRKDGSFVWLSESARAVFDESGTVLYYEGIAEDISARKRAEEEKDRLNTEIREQRERLNTIVATVPGIVFEAWGPPGAADNRTDFVSEYLEQMLGYSVEEWLATPRFWLSVVHPDDRERVEKEAASRFAECRNGELEFRWIGKDKRIVCVRAHTIIICDADGKSIGMRGVVTDITERKRADENLRASEEKYRTILERMEEGYAEVDLAGTYVFVNDSFCRITGRSKSELLGVSYKEIFDREHRQLLFDTYHNVYETGEPIQGFEFEVTRKDGTKRFVEESVSLKRDAEGRPIGFMGIRRDCTDRKQAEEALRESEERYRDLVENAHDIIYTHDLQGRYTSMNKAGGVITGYTREEALALDFTNTVAPEYVGKAQEMLRKKLAGEKDTAYEMEIIAKDGHRITVEANTKLVFQNGVAVGVQGIARDVTDRKHLEEQLRQSQKMEAIGQLAGGVAHDFNNLLTAINGYSGLALQTIDDNHPLRGYLEEIKKAGDRAANLTRQLLAFGRKQILQPLPINLNDVVTDMNKMLRRLIGEDIVLIAKLDPALKKIKADPGQIEQVLVNLIVNARHAMPQGGKLTIETLDVDLDQEYAARHVGVEPGRYVMLAVSDTGTGMSEDTRARIFDPFFTTKEKGKGTGLGLSTVYGIVKQSGGNIWVYSELGHGTTFKVYLPELTAGSLKTETAIVESPIPGGSETILLVEDEDVVRGLARKILEHAGYKVVKASCGKEAIRLCLERAEPIDLLLTDVVMPETSGKEVADRLTELLPGLRVLFMSGYTDEAIVHHGVLDSNVEFIQKPFTPAALVRKVRAVLDSELVISDSVSLLPKGEGEIEVEHEHHDA
jgi:PAS domain S-box-containing protein